MADDWQTYVKDPRIVCKYGGKCYQKNPEHHRTFKHPPNQSTKIHDKRKRKRYEPYQRKEVPSSDSKTEGKQSSSTEYDSQRDTKEHNIRNMDRSDNLNDAVVLPENLTYFAKDDHSVIQELFLTVMPQDFYKFYECLNEENGIENQLSSVNLELIGPYDLLLGKLPVLDDKSVYLIHWRFFYDPPEFQAVIKKKGKSEFHMGYFRDNPKENPVFVASNDSAKDYHITPVAKNIFGAVYIHLQKEKNSSPFVAMACQKIMDKIKKYATEHQYSLEQYNVKERKAKIVSNSFHCAGIVVPYDKKSSLGYRPLVENDANLKKMFKKLEEATSEVDKDKVLSEIQPVITYANIAVDECDFGTGLEAGINLFCSGLKELEPSALNSLCAVYSLLNRGEFAKIIQVHLKHRRRGPDMSLLNINNK